MWANNGRPPVSGLAVRPITHTCGIVIALHIDRAGDCWLPLPCQEVASRPAKVTTFMGPLLRARSPQRSAAQLSSAYIPPFRTRLPYPFPRSSSSRDSTMASNTPSRSFAQKSTLCHATHSEISDRCLRVQPPYFCGAGFLNRDPGRKMLANFHR